MRTKKDVEQMNRFELMNEVERLRNSDQSSQLQTEIGWLKQELRVTRERMLKMEKALDHMADRVPNLRSSEDRRKQPQGRRKAKNRRDTK